MKIDTKEGFAQLTSTLIKLGYENEIIWQRRLTPCNNYNQFIQETIWVILNSGMREQVARKLNTRIWQAVDKGIDIGEVFKHKGKVAAIKQVMNEGHEMFAAYLAAGDKIAFLQTLPFIGKITCYHLAKNLGHDCVKPDRHLVRVAKKYGTTPDELCQRISELTGEKKCVVDIIIWRACNQEIL